MTVEVLAGRVSAFEVRTIQMATFSFARSLAVDSFRLRTIPWLASSVSLDFVLRPGVMGAGFGGSSFPEGIFLIRLGDVTSSPFSFASRMATRGVHGQRPILERSR